MQKDLPLISIIVPVYQVEEYISQCIESILKQTYTNLEIILVDDGSEDRSGEICDKYAEDEQRIRVIHKLNGGLSDARNAGLAVAAGEYIGFVDSDDWIEPGMYETLYSVLEHKGDIAVCNYYYDDVGKERVVMCGKEGMFDTYSALEKLIADETPNYAWNKLYHKDIFEGILFPQGKKFEDVAIMYLLFERADTICFLDKPLYHYRYRQSGIIGNKSVSGMLDYCEFRIDRYRYFEVKYPNMCCRHIHGIADATVRMAADYIISNGKERRKNIRRRYIIRQYYDENIVKHGYMLSRMERLIFYLATRQRYLSDVLAVVLEVIRRKVVK